MENNMKTIFFTNRDIVDLLYSNRETKKYKWPMYSVHIDK